MHVTKKENDDGADKAEATLCCSQAEQSKAASEPDAETEDERSVPPLPIENCLINGVPLEGTQDTAANLNAIKPQIASRLGLESKKVVTYPVKGISGAVMVTEEVSANITVGRETVYCPLAIIDHIPRDVLIGRPNLADLMIYLTQGEGEDQIKWSLYKCHKQTEPQPVYSLSDIEKSYPSVLEEKEPKVVIDFQLRPDPEITRKLPYKLSNEKMKWAQTKINELLQRKMIQPSSSRYAAPVVIVKKEGGDYRMCQDYRELNKQAIPDPFPLPLIDDIISSLGGCQFFSRIDLKDGFYQIALSEETRHYTAFVLPFGQFEMCRLPFGFKNSPAIFQRAMMDIIRPLQVKHPQIHCYVDDIVCGAKTMDECAHKTGLVLDALSRHGMQINVNKTELGTKKVKLLGRLIDGYTKSTREESIEKVKTIERPHDVNTVRRFSGLTGHFRAFIPNYADIVRPLDRLKKKDADFIWTEDCEVAFLKLKDMIVANPVLQLPDWDLPFELVTDASAFGSGSVLYQRDETQPRGRKSRCIGFQSYTFTKAEISYSTTEKEGLAVKKALKYFQSYLEGKKFILYTDHQALVSILNMTHPSGKLARWAAFFLSFDFEVVHRKGENLQDADAISRLCLQPRAVITYLKPEEEIDLLTKKRILHNYHDDSESGGHDGFSRTYWKIKRRFNWPNMRQEIADYCKTCYECQVQKFKFRIITDQMSLPPHAETPFHTVHLDYAELEKKKEGLKTT